MTQEERNQREKLIDDITEVVQRFKVINLNRVYHDKVGLKYIEIPKNYDYPLIYTVDGNILILQSLYTDELEILIKQINRTI